MQKFSIFKSIKFICAFVSFYSITCRRVFNFFFRLFYFVSFFLSLSLLCYLFAPWVIFFLWIKFKYEFESVSSIDNMPMEKAPIETNSISIYRFSYEIFWMAKIGRDKYISREEKNSNATISLLNKYIECDEIELNRLPLLLCPRRCQWLKMALTILCIRFLRFIHCNDHFVGSSSVDLPNRIINMDCNLCIINCTEL